MSDSENKRLQGIRNRVQRYDFGKTIQICSDIQFLLTIIDAEEAELNRLRTEIQRIKS
jgi:hypothetical protein